MAMKVSNRLDKIASSLQEKKLVHLAYALDTVSNTFDKFAFKGEGMKNAISEINKTILDFRGGALRESLWGIIDSLAFQAEDGLDLWNIGQKQVSDAVQDTVISELTKAGRFTNEFKPILHIAFPDFRIVSNNEEFEKAYQEGHLLTVVVYAKTVMDRSYLQPPQDLTRKQGLLALALAPEVMKSLDAVLHSSKVKMSKDPSSLHNLKPLLWRSVQENLSTLVTHEMTHAYQYVQTTVDEKARENESAWRSSRKDKDDANNIQNYRHPSLDIETEAVREEVEAFFNSAIKTMSPQRVDQLLLPPALLHTLFLGWEAHTPDDLRGVFRAVQLLERDKLLSTKILSTWKLYLKKIMDACRKPQKEVPSEPFFKKEERADSERAKEMLGQKQKVQDIFEKLRHSFKDVDFTVYTAWDPKPNMLENPHVR